jgi:hypothetical protein
MSTKPRTPNPEMERRRATYILQEAHKADAANRDMPFAEWVDRRAVDRPELAEAAHTWIGENELAFQEARRARDQALLAIAAKHLFVTTLETRNHDSRDFHEVSVWGIKSALEAAYAAGRASK